MLPPDEGALFEKAPEAPHATLFRAGGLDGGTSNRSSVGWSDPLVHVAEAALTNIEETSPLPADRFQAILHVDADDATIAGWPGGP